jgi:two-component system heavy metal sensor histidine kinase CusS
VRVETTGMASDLPSTAFPEAVDLKDPDPETRELRTSAGRTYRLVAIRTSEAGSGPYTLQVAVDLSFEKDLLAGYRSKLWIVLGLGLFASILIGRRIATRGLRPLGEISETVRRIRSTNLREHVPLDRMPSEVQQLASTFNDMLHRLGDSFERLSQFSSDIAHELRTPLNNLRGEIDLALSKKRSPEEYVDLLGSLSEECEQLARLIDSLLFLARAEQPAIQINRERVDIARELRLVCDFYEPAATEVGVRLSVTAPEQLSPQLDRTLFQRAVGNLVQNALAHTPNGGHVWIEAQNSGEGLAISVSDTGAGISEEHLPRVFDRFYRADPARARNSGGYGLGLPIVQSIARLHGGNVAIASNVGQGTKVTLTLSSGSVEV